MRHSLIHLLVAFAATTYVRSAVLEANTAMAQSFTRSQAPVLQKAALPFRPIGSPSRVDTARQSPSAVRTDASRQGMVETAYNSAGTNLNQNGNIRQTAMQSGGFALPPGGGFSPSPGGGSTPQITPPPTLSVPPSLSVPPELATPSTQPSLSTPPQREAAPRQLPVQRQLPDQPNANAAAVPQGGQFQPGQQAVAPNQFGGPNTGFAGGQGLPTGSDLQYLAPPQINNGGFATMSDCRLITPPSGYSAMSPYGPSCGYGGVAPVGYGQPYVPPPAQIASPATMPQPTQLVPLGNAPGGPNGQFSGGVNPAPVGSLVTFGQENFPVQVGQGLWGQPVAYVPGQAVRNWLRYLSF